MEILIAILIYIGVLSSGQQVTVEEVHMLEIQHRARIDEVRSTGVFDKPVTLDKTVWDHEEL
jgi:hypothetical protein